MDQAPDRDLLLTRAWSRPGRRQWLALDLVSGARILELEDLESQPVSSPGAIVIGGPVAGCSVVPGGGLLLGEGVLWSLLDPLRAGDYDDGYAVDRVSVETALREAVARFQRRLAWWRRRDAGLRSTCRRLLSGGDPDLGPFCDLLEQAPLPEAAPTAAETDSAEPARGAGAAGRPCPAEPEDLYGWFTADDGLGAVVGAEFTPRLEQAEMAREVAHALVQRIPLMVEAGTGVGKTLAYLAAVLATVTAGDRRTVISTHTRALQSQIMNIDLPRLAPLLGEKRFQLLMGRRNYLCLRQRQAFLSRTLESTSDALQAAAFRVWLEATHEGMRDEIADHPVLAPAASELFDAADLCLPGMCYEGRRCHVQQARRRAREADILVVNHSLLLHDQRAGGTLLGEYDSLIVDEAHRLPAVVLDTHAVSCGLWRLGELEDVLGRVGRGVTRTERLTLAQTRLAAHGPEGTRAAAAAGVLDGAVRRVFKGFRGWWRALGSHADGYLSGGARERGRIRIRDKDEFFGPLRADTAGLLEGLAEAEAAYASFASRVDGIENLGGGLEDDLAQVAQAGQLLRQLHRDLDFLTNDPDENWVTWLEPARQKGAARLGATLLEAGGVLRDYWLDADLRPVMTSATLAVGEDFSHMLRELGLSRRRPPTITWTSPSPFDFHRQTLVLAPTHFPEPQATGFGRAVGELLAALASGPARKTMALFTSYRAIREAQEVLEAAGLDPEPRAMTSEVPALLVQSPRTAAGALVEQFRRHRRALLLGTATFWEGVDFPGDDLEILVVTKLPFLVPNDPWVEARCERLQAAGENPFTSFMVRDAVLRLRQGCGRLIRRASDRGVVLILDNRLHTKNYGTTFLAALPTMPAMFGDEDDMMTRIEEFFRRR